MAYSLYTTTTATTQPAFLPPAVPVFRDPITGSDRVILQWTGSADTVGYVLELRPPGGEWEAAYQGTGTQITISGLTPETTYEFRLKATNAAGDSGWATITVTTKAQTEFERIIRFARLEAATPKDSSIIKGI